MSIRVTALFCLSLVFVVGGLAATDRVTVAQAPANNGLPIAQAAPSPPAVIEPQPDTPATPPEAVAPPVVAPPVVTAPPVVAPAPVVMAPPAQAEPAVVTAPPPVAAPPVATAPTAAEPPPPEAAPTPVVIQPAPMPPERPAIVEKKEPQPAKLLFAAKTLPSLGKAMAIGYYPRGCLSGGVELPANGPTWQVMRLSRNRNWGHPNLVRYLEKFAPLAAKATGWKGILVGDLAQPRGGPTPTGHMSHQTGLDVDIWFMPMPGHTLSSEEREKTSAINVVSADWKSLNPKYWTPQHIAFIKTAAAAPEVERVLVNAAIKQEICRVETKNREGWMSKVRPWYAHHDHIHVRLKCPADSPNCRPQPPVPGDDGCGKEALAFWFSDKVLKPKKPAGPVKPPKPLTMADLPPACKNVLDAPEKQAKSQ